MTTPLLLFLALLGAPLFAVIAASALFGFSAQDIDLTVVILEINRVVETPVLISVPLFTFAGYVMGESRSSRRLVDLSQAVLGWMPGGFGVITVVICALFTAFSGASGTTIVALGSLLYPALVDQGYSERFSLGLITTAGSLGLLFPPAVPLILYGVVSGVDINQLFLAGIIPGSVMLLFLAALCVFHSLRRGLPTQAFSLANLARALRASCWEIPLPFVVMGGIYGGFFAVSEAAAITACYVLISELLIYREIPFRRLFSIIVQSMSLVGALLIILAVSFAATNLLIDQQVPSRLFHFVQSAVHDKTSFLFLLLLFLLALGCLLDIFSATVLIVPLLLPLAGGFGLDPIHLGIVFLAAMQIGYCTPPVGMNLFISAYRFEVPVMRVVVSVLPFLGVLLAAVVLLLLLPWLSLRFV